MGEVPLYTRSCSALCDSVWGVKNTSFHGVYSNKSQGFQDFCIENGGSQRQNLVLTILFVVIRSTVDWLGYERMLE